MIEFALLLRLHSLLSLNLLIFLGRLFVLHFVAIIQNFDIKLIGGAEK